MSDIRSAANDARQLANQLIAVQMVGRVLDEIADLEDARDRARQEAATARAEANVATQECARRRNAAVESLAEAEAHERDARERAAAAISAAAEAEAESAARIAAATAERERVETEVAAAIAAVRAQLEG